MKFLDWLNEQEEQEPNIPDIKRFSYIACVLTAESQSRLLNSVNTTFQGKDIPNGWQKVAHHMTVKKPGSLVQTDLQNPMMGKEVKLWITKAAADEYAMAVVVNPVAVDFSYDFQMKQVPHITVAYDSKVVKPVYSNDLLKNPQNVFDFTGRMVLDSYFVAVEYDQTKTWPISGAFLASSRA